MPDPMPPASDRCDYDLFIIGGGVNGCGIARDAAGRGLKVGLAERHDLASGTSSQSTKLIHGGLRYLEYLEFRLVRESLRERETLLAAMPHIAWPLRFVLPLDPDMKSAPDSPAGRALAICAPWLRGRRPAWMIRLGLLLYDHLGVRGGLPGTTRLDLAAAAEGAPLKAGFIRAYEYSDCWVQDSRLVVLNARDAATRGADILTRTEFAGADRERHKWNIRLALADGHEAQVSARALVNAAGPWVSEVGQRHFPQTNPKQVRLVRGSHIVTRRLYDHEKCYVFQGEDGRIIFVIPFEEHFTLIGTTEAEIQDADEGCSEGELRYLCERVSRYLRRQVSRDDIVWSYSGVRPLQDSEASSATAASRDYELLLDGAGAPLLSIYGGKLTTYRKLAEHALAKLAPHFPALPAAWTAAVPLPGGDFGGGTVAQLTDRLCACYPDITAERGRRLVRTYGTDIFTMFSTSLASRDDGFGAGISEAELQWVVDQEWVRNAEDFLWRRTRLGLRVTEAETARIDAAIHRMVARR
ncbi:MAG: glycerol-3-phosphate dehydrogenase [Rhodobacteraceae bacterium]|nr:glycerol-3-phosphate dehydrogenase [Paracoccaceae bacterium]